jgi:alkylation response protein AidB-like acyl-CoA dehydrogenase
VTAVDLANTIAEDVLLPAAAATDAADLVPTSNLDALAEAGLYGIFAPPALGGLGEPGAMPEVIEVLASGCLTTTLVWIQHFGLLGALLGGPEHLRERWLEAACRGQVRGGIAFGGLLPVPPALTATRAPEDDGWRLDGHAPWVSGWGRIDLVHVAARTIDDRVVNLVIDATEAPPLRITRQRLAAVDASNTVRLDFDAMVVPDERVLSIDRYDPAGSLGLRLRLNGSLALGAARRATALLGVTPLDDELTAARDRLDGATADEMAAARAAASELALRSAAAAVVHAGSRAVGADQHEQRLLREALFLLVFGSRPPIKASLLERLGAASGGAT